MTDNLEHSLNLPELPPLPGIKQSDHNLSHRNITESKRNTQLSIKKTKEYESLQRKCQRRLDSNGYNTGDEEKVVNLNAEIVQQRQKYSENMHEYTQKYSNLPISKGVEACVEILKPYSEQVQFHTENNIHDSFKETSLKKFKLE